jgi:hypothetical protein
VPFLLLDKDDKHDYEEELENKLHRDSQPQNVGKSGPHGLGWRRLPRPEIPAKFFHRCTQTHTMGPEDKNSNLPNSPLFLSPLSPVDACQYEPPAVEIPVEAVFISDARGDLERVMLLVEKQIKVSGGGGR